MASVMSRGRSRRTISEINMVPFINVMLVLLIIFMVTAPLISPSMIDLPSAGKAAKQPDLVLQIVIGKDESLQLKLKDQSNSMSLKDIVSAVKQAQTEAANSAVVISADKNVRYESVVKVMDSLQRAGVSRVGLAVQLAP